MFGYGVKAFGLSMVECAIQVTEGAVPTAVIAELVERARDQLQEPVRLLPDVPEVLEEVGRRYRLALITKGDLIHQTHKVDLSGLAHHFEHIEIVLEKDTDTYAELLTPLRCRAVTVLHGRQQRASSDILPVMALGGHGVHVPYELLWELEHIDHDEQLTELKTPRRPAWLAEHARLTFERDRQEPAVTTGAMVASVCCGDVSSSVAVESGVVSSVETTVSSVVGVTLSSLPLTAMPAPTPMPIATTAATATSHHRRRVGGAVGGATGGAAGGGVGRIGRARRRDRRRWGRDDGRVRHDDGWRRRDRWRVDGSGRRSGADACRAERHRLLRVRREHHRQAQLLADERRRERDA